MSNFTGPTTPAPFNVSSLASPLAGIGGNSVSVAQKARKLLRAASRAQRITTAATPPTITNGAVGVASTMTTGAGNSGAAAFGGQTDGFTSARLAQVSGGLSLNSSSNGYTPLIVTSNGQAASGYRAGQMGAGVAFFFDGQVFEICASFGGSTKYRLAVTDMSTGIRQWAQAADVFPNVGGTSYSKVDFGSRANRIVELYVGNQSPTLYGMNFNKTDKVRPAYFPDDPKILIVGDSYEAGTNVLHLRGAPGYLFGEMMGCRNVNINGYGGTGYLNDAATGHGTFVQRIQAGDCNAARIGDMDLVLVIGSVNDAVVNNAAWTDAAYQAAVQTGIAAMMTAQPNAIILSCPPQFVKNSQTSAARYNACKAGTLAAASSDTSGRVSYVDTSPSGDAWQTGTGTSTATAGDGSNDFFGASDGIHLITAGWENYADGMFLSTTKFLQTLV